MLHILRFAQLLTTKNGSTYVLKKGKNKKEVKKEERNVADKIQMKKKEGNEYIEKRGKNITVV